MVGSKERRTYVFYGPPHFRATWQKFKEILERDGKNMSQELRIWIEGYVARKDPGNPQRPFTAYLPGHPDEASLLRQELFKKYCARAKLTYGVVLYRRILLDLKAWGVTPSRRVSIARPVARDLEELGIKVMY